MSFNAALLLTVYTFVSVHSYQGMGNESGMALLDVGFLSGFTLKTEDFTRPTSLKLVEPKKDRVYLYFDSVSLKIN